MTRYVDIIFRSLLVIGAVLIFDGLGLIALGIVMWVKS